MKLNNSQDAIKQAILNGGYGNDDWRKWAGEDVNALKGYQFAELYGADATHQKMLDPVFWQALGKARGWEETVTYYNSFVDGKENNDPWRLFSLRWFETRMSNRDESAFWQSLP